ncbi:hypothetical protein BELL_0061g00250 [Botrytis elliptica]|uniref:Uncharacterized protein n=1 Tax=Botrytis elliptica TaxID=278938 RepID=A0A4Z1JXG2_9HELO|nr:hypothetical protein BELL_0061g00250 [Botrytis elliptica]
MFEQYVQENPHSNSVCNSSCMHMSHVSEGTNYQSNGRCKASILVVLSLILRNTSQLCFDATREDDTDKSGKFV